MSTWAYGLPAAPEAKEVGGLPQRSGICSHISCWGGERAWDAPARMCTPQARNAAGPCARAGSRSGDHPAALRPSPQGHRPGRDLQPPPPGGADPGLPRPRAPQHSPALGTHPSCRPSYSIRPPRPGRRRSPTPSSALGPAARSGPAPPRRAPPPPPVRRRRARTSRYLFFFPPFGVRLSQ